MNPSLAAASFKHTAEEKTTHYTSVTHLLLRRLNTGLTLQITGWCCEIRYMIDSQPIVCQELQWTFTSNIKIFTFLAEVAALLGLSHSTLSRASTQIGAKNNNNNKADDVERWWWGEVMSMKASQKQHGSDSKKQNWTEEEQKTYWGSRWSGQRADQATDGGDSGRGGGGFLITCFHLYPTKCVREEEAGDSLFFVGN